MDDDKPLLSKISTKNVAFIGLISIFSVLLAQSALGLFVEMDVEELAQIDIVFRTAMSSIFGYLMSMVSTSDFMVKQRVIKTNVNSAKTIGFNTTNDENITKFAYNSENPTNEVATKIETAPVVLEKPAKTFAINLQIIVLSLVCIFCLVILLIVRNFSELIVSNSTNAVTISTYRDIISGTIGALIGLSRTN